MKFKEFKQVIELLKKVSDRAHNAYQIGIDLMDYDEEYHKAITILMKRNRYGCM
jgi:hypothetical protein